jgi:hypothetical protein
MNVWSSQTFLVNDCSFSCHEVQPYTHGLLELWVIIEYSANFLPIERGVFEAGRCCVYADVDAAGLEEGLESCLSCFIED